MTSRQWLHFIPAIIHAAIFWVIPFTDTQISFEILTGQVDPTTAQLELVDTITNIEILSSMGHVMLYLWLSIHILNQHLVRIKATFSYVEQISLQWLRRLVTGVLIVYLLWVLEDLISGIVNLDDTFDGMLSLGLIILIYAMSYLGLRQPLIFTHQNEPKNQLDTKNAHKTTTEKYKTSSLSNDLSQLLLDELQHIMQQERPHLDSQLSLPKLAKRLEVSTNQLSQIINEQLQQNFFDFINGYRISEAKIQLQVKDQKNQNILTIATNTGFNSKSAFYTAFKKHTGMTPGEFRKQTNAKISKAC
jgi:AraC-like DNA-binding protein